MITVLADALDVENEKEDEIIKPVADKVVYTYVENKPFEIHRDPDGVWVVSGKQVEDLFKITKFTEDEGVRRFAAKLKKMGVDEELERQGAMPGDDVAIMNYMFTFKE
jgi:GTP-binding protein